jgi:flagellar basal-body rod protein FlgC
MSLFNVFDIAGSAMTAQSQRLNSTASNLANANSSASSLEKTYRARQPVFEPMLDGFADDASESAVGVQVSGIVESQAPLQRDYEPGNPMADEQGYVFKPNVNTVEEMANMIAASRSYQTSVEIMDASKQMLTRTLAIGQQ